MEHCASAQDTRIVTTYTVDVFAQGVAIGQHRVPAGAVTQLCDLRINDQDSLPRLRSRYSIHRENPVHELELFLMRLSQLGELGSAVVHFGVTSDPFHPFAGRFDLAMKMLELFKRYQPGLLRLQTRSPLVVIAMPVLRVLGERAAVTLGIETPDDEMVQRYTPGLPRAGERLRAASALRRFGLEVTLQVSPVLPYGEWRRDALQFAELLDQHGDYVVVKPLSDGTPERERKIRATSLARALAHDRRFHWLRHDAANPLISALEERCASKLMLPPRAALRPKQTDMFAA